MGSDTVAGEIPETKSIPGKEEPGEQTMYLEIGLDVQQGEDV